MGINKATVRWVIHYQVPLLLSEYIQEVGRGGRDRQPADAISLVSEPTGWLDSSDRQRQQFFEQQAQKQVRLAQTLLHQLPSTGEIEAVEQQFPQAPLALALLHRLGQLEWLDPFHYHLYPRQNLKLISTQMKNAATQAMNHYVYTRVCRWQFLLAAFGFEQEALKFCCGHCDNCQPQRYGFRIS
jgi:ATP-dependent DNA helicase RecQ